MRHATTPSIFLGCRFVYIKRNGDSFITGELPLPPDCDIVIKRGYISSPREEKGMGSAYGGEWQPKKPDDERFLGKPGEIKETRAKNGYDRHTKIGRDGRAVKERHYTDHKQPWAHTNPHDHLIDWNYPQKGVPNMIKPHINYFEEVPDLSKHKGDIMSTNKNVNYNSFNEFDSIGDFSMRVVRGAEICFVWNNKMYVIDGSSPKGIVFSEGCYEKDGKYYNIYSHTEYDPKDESAFVNVDELLQHTFDGVILRDIILKSEITDCTL